MIDCHLSDAPRPSAVFVYGTLQRGECRETCWPHPPVAIQRAATRGRLYDLGPYPAMIAGEDTIGGELWRLAPEHVAHSLEVLDAVEDAATEAAGSGIGLYVRRVVACRVIGSEDIVPAFAYFYAQPRAIDGMPRVEPDEDGICRWPLARETLTRG